MSTNPSDHHQIISIADTAALLTVSKTTVYNYINAGLLPAPLRLGPRRVGYRLSDIRDWLDARAAAVGVQS